jgi:predicted DNA-binding protein
MIEYRRGTGRGRTAAPGKDTDMGRTQTVGRAEEAGERGWGRRLSEQTSLQMDPELANLVRIIKANEGRSVGEILRDAVERGLPKVAGYRRAQEEYDGGRRIAKAPATGGRPRREGDGLSGSGA